MLADTTVADFEFSAAIEDDLLVSGGQCDSVWETFQFSVRSMISFFSPPEADLDIWDRWLQIGLRFLGPAILTQAILTIREKVAR